MEEQLVLTGRVVKLLPTQTGTGSKGVWKKKEFIIETLGQYPKKVCFASWGDKADAVENLTEGETLKIYFNVESREYNDRWYNEIKAWKWESGASNKEAAAVTQKTESSVIGDQDDDLPF
jgi:hypothetical protein